MRPITGRHFEAKSKGVMSVKTIMGVNLKAKDTGVVPVRPVIGVNLKVKNRFDFSEAHPQG